MKKYLILLALALTGFVAKAENYVLKVTLQGSTSATYVLDARPIISYSGNDVIIKSQSLEDKYAINEVESFTFVDEAEMDVDNLTQNVTYQFHNNVFTCEGHDIRVFNISGQQVAAGNSSVSLESLEHGIYIVSTGKRAIKVMKN